MKPRYYIWAITSLLLVSGGLVLLWDTRPSKGNEFEELLPNNPEVADVITLISEYDSLRFILLDSQWTYGDEVLNQQAVENLLLAAGSLTMKSILPKGDLNELNYKLELVLLNGKKELSRYIFGRAGRQYYIFSEGSEVAFGVELTGYENMPLEKIFSIHADHYRKHMLIDLLPFEIQSIETTPLFGSPFRSVQDTGYNIIITDLQEKNDFTHSVDERRMRLLFSYFNSIRYNEVMGDETYVAGRGPSASIVLTDFSGNMYKLDIYQWIKQGQKKADIFEALVIFNDGTKTLSVDYYFLDLIMRGLEKYQADQ